MMQQHAARRKDWAAWQAKEEELCDEIRDLGEQLRTEQQERDQVLGRETILEQELRAERRRRIDLEAQGGTAARSRRNLAVKVFVAAFAVQPGAADFGGYLEGRGPGRGPGGAPGELQLRLGGEDGERGRAGVEAPGGGGPKSGGEGQRRAAARRAGGTERTEGVASALGRTRATLPATGATSSCQRGRGVG